MREKPQQELLDEEMRLLQIGGDVFPWQKWGPYVSERAWGTVREDYSSNGEAWDHFTYQMAIAKAFRWGEDGIAGICDRYQVMALTHAFWNGQDPILKERLYGLGTFEGNHGEDVKEYYFHLDNLPSHSYMKYLYKYPCQEYPYEELLHKNRGRDVKELEYELLDTGIFDDDRYFDIYIEYAKASKDDICIRVEAFNRSSKEEVLTYIPQIVFRNTWSWKKERRPEPSIRKGHDGNGAKSLILDDTTAIPPSRLNFDYHLGPFYLYADERAERLFTNNETNENHLTGGKNASPFVKDAFHRHIIHGEKECVNPKEEGTKACFVYKDVKIPPKGSKVFFLRLTNTKLDHPLTGVEEIIHKRERQANEFYEKIHPKNATEDEKKIQRQAFAGMLWNKQIYLYDLNLWLRGDNPDCPPPESRKNIRNTHWKHLVSKRILSMPDKWEYPWFAAWDLAFHCVTLALIDLNFAKEQVWYLLFDQFQHPNGQIPAYEWEFSELNPPVQAWAALRLFKMEEKKTGKRDISFLKKCFHKLLLNFVWWVNKVDAKGNNVFEGGFLGLDNITVIDRSEKIPGGGKLEQSDGTGWMGMFCVILMRISLELAKEDNDYESLAVKFFEHFVYIANALVNADTRKIQNWNEEDGFFYDVINFSDNHQEQIKVRSLVGIIPLYANDCIDDDDLTNFKEFSKSFEWFTTNRPDLCAHCVTPIEKEGKTKYLLSLMNIDRMKRVLGHVWNPGEFRSNFGLRSLSKFYENNPYELLGNTICYEPGEAISRLKGGNSNWRGPIWFPTNFLLIESLNRFHGYLGDEFQIEGKNLKEMARYFAHSLIKVFKKDEKGERPIYGHYNKFQTDPYWKDHLLFYEHYHGETGRGLGASHQTGWSGLVANLIDEWLCEH